MWDVSVHHTFNQSIDSLPKSNSYNESGGTKYLPLKSVVINGSIRRLEDALGIPIIRAGLNIPETYASLHTIYTDNLLMKCAHFKL